MAVRGGYEIGYLNRETMEWVAVGYLCRICGNRISRDEPQALFKSGLNPEYVHQKCLDEVSRFLSGEHLKKEEEA